MGETRSLKKHISNSKEFEGFFIEEWPWVIHGLVSSAKSLQGKASNEKNIRRMNKLLVADTILHANLLNNSGPLSLSLLFLAM